MAETVFKASAHLQEGVQVKVRSRGFEIIVDEPESLGGTDTGMNPVEMVLCALGACQAIVASVLDRKSTRLNSSHVAISYAVFCLKKKKDTTTPCIHLMSL